MGNIKIIAPPDGEAPYDVRVGWVGVILPLAVDGVQYTESCGVLSSSDVTIEPGYIVESRTALMLLAHHDLVAAHWWRDNVPEFFEPGMQFFFSVEACEETEDFI